MKLPGFEKLSTTFRIERCVAVVACLLFTPLVHGASFQVSVLAAPERTREQSVLPVRAEPGGAADLMVVSVTDTSREYQLYRARAEGYLALDDARRLADDIVVLDDGRIAGRDVVIAFGAGSAWVFNPYTGERTHLLDITSLYSTPIRTIVPRLDLLRDVNGDGRDDIIVPGFAGYQVSTQQEDGAFGPLVTAFAPPLVEISFNDYPFYQPRQAYQADMDLDGQGELVFWLDDGLNAYAFNALGDLEAEAVRPGGKPPIDFGSMDDMSISMRDEDQSDASARALLDIGDVDGDSVADLLTLTVDSQGVFRKTTTYELWQGTAGEGEISFGEGPSARIESKGFQFEAEGEDMDGDGQVDMMISTVEIGIGKILSALITGSVRIDLNFYRMRDGQYPARPDLRKDVTATLDLGRGDFFFPTVLLTDVDGDGVSDLLLQEGEEKMKIFTGLGDERLFSRRSIDITAPMASDPDLVDVIDLNGDGRSDIVMRLDKTGEPRRVVVLLSADATQAVTAR